MRERAWVALLLAWIAGGVDADGYISLTHLFTAHLSGNTAAFAATTGSGNWHEAIRRFFPIPVFVFGVFLAALIVDAGRRRKSRYPLLPAFIIEFVLVLVCVLTNWQSPILKAPSPAFWAVAGMLSLAMGMQNATLSRVGRTVVRTTYITGMLTSFAETGAQWCFWLYDRSHGRGFKRLALALRVSLRREHVRDMLLFAGIWIGFAVGAAMSGYAETFWQWHALFLPLGGILLVTIASARWRGLRE